MYDEKWILYDNRWQPAQWLDRKKLQSTSQSQTWTEKRSWSLFDGLLLIWSTTFWIPVKPAFHLRSMLSESMKYPENCHTCSQHWSPKRWPKHYSLNNVCPYITQPTLQKLNKLGYEVLPHPPCSPGLLPTNSHFFKHFNNFLQGKHFHKQQKAGNAFQEFVESWSMNFYTIGINKLISHWQKCVDCSGSYFD